MEEFLNLILTGERLQRFKRFNLLFKAAAVAQSLFAFPLLFTASSSVHAAVSAVFGTLLTVCGVFCAVLSFQRAGLCKSLLGEQTAADGATCDEVGAARKKLAEKYAELNTGKNGAAVAALRLLPVAVYLAAAVLSVLVNLGIAGHSYLVPVLYVVATICTVVIALIPAAEEGRNRAALYGACDEEIALLKRNAGFADSLIAKQSYNAKNTATRSQELFLCDPADRAELRKLARAAGYSELALAVILVAVISAMGFMSEHFDEKFLAVSSACLIVGVLVLWIAVAVRTEVRRRAIYRRNAAKLSDSEPDRLRRSLQNEFVRLQRGGNIFFSLFCGIPTVVGFILGAASAVNDPELSFIENASGTAFVFFLISAVAALIIWIVIYALYRNKVKPVEMQLDTMRD